MCDTEAIISAFQAESDTPAEPVAPLTREEKWRLEREEAERRHMIQVAENVEKAKDPTLYDTYTAGKAAFDEQIRFFAARRRGRSHMADGSPCQDYCMTADCAMGLILTDADGVGSCKRSDIGSRMACEVTVELIRELAEKASSEEEFARQIASLRFREILVQRWLNRVLAHIKEYPVPPEYGSKPHECYGSTLLFAVITAQFYIVGNLGDGQILLFNAAEGVKLRFHKPKETPKTRALVHPNCAREDFQIGTFRRRDFDGILLCTDGMYDVLCNGSILHQYALELKTRFLEAGEPLQPFCFVERDQPMRDLYSHRTKDDCSLVLALDCSGIELDAFGRFSGLGVDGDSILLQSVEGQTACYKVVQEQSSLHVITVPEGTPLPDLPETELLPLVQPMLRYVREGIHYSVYPHMEQPTLMQMYHMGQFREQAETLCNASAAVLRLYRRILDCHRMLEHRGLRFAPGAHTLIRVDEAETLLLYPEAVEPISESAGTGFAQIRSLFENLVGALVCGDRERPLFHPGVRRMGQQLSCLAREEPLCRVRNAGGGMQELVNTGTSPWILEDGEKVEPGEAVSLERSVSFRVMEAAETPEYQFIRKESMEYDDYFCRRCGV